MYEQEMTSQIERRLVEIEKNHASYLKQNPILSVREVNLESEQLEHECANARGKLREYAERFSRSDTARSPPLPTGSQG